MSTSTTNPDAHRLLDFWFDDAYPITRRFAADPALDADLRTRFGSLVASARTPALDSWQSHPHSTLALILLLDQLPRNIHRDTPDAFSSDAKALSVTTTAIAKGFDKQVPLNQQAFFYLPLVHTETLLGQIAGKAQLEVWEMRCVQDEKVREFASKGVVMAQKHMDVIMMFGRYPSRNEARGWESTEEEKEFLRENPTGFVR